MMNVKWYMKCFIYWTADLKSSELWLSQLWTQWTQWSYERNEYLNESWLAQSCVVAKWNLMLYRWLGVVRKTEKLASPTIVMSLKCKRSVLSIKDKNEDADDIVFQMICKSVLSRLNVVSLNLTNFAWFCSSLIFIFSSNSLHMQKLFHTYAVWRGCFQERVRLTQYFSNQRFKSWVSEA